MTFFEKSNFQLFNYLWLHFTYSSVLHLNLKLKTFHLDLIFSHFLLESIFKENGSNEVVSFFLFQTLILEFHTLGLFLSSLSVYKRLWKLPSKIMMSNYAGKNFNNTMTTFDWLYISAYFKLSSDQQDLYLV